MTKCTDAAICSAKSSPDADVRELVDALHETYGVDLRGYSASSLERRVRFAQSKLQAGSIEQLKERLLLKPQLVREFLDELTVQTTDMFRDPAVFLAFRRDVVPLLKTYPVLRVWVAGCATGEEAYTMAVILAEEGLLDRTQIYATDVSDRAIARAKRGVLAARHVQRFTENYRQAGGVASFSDYYTLAYDHVVMRESLRRSIVFFQHDLVGDYVFSTVHVVFCRNVLIYFGNALKAQVLAKFQHGLVQGGFLCIGTSERLRSGQWPFVPFVETQRIYRWLPSGSPPRSTPPQQ